MSNLNLNEMLNLNDLLNLNEIPEDVIRYVVIQTDVEDIFELCKVSINFNIICRRVLYDKIPTKLDISNYSLKQIKILYKNITFGTKRIVTDYSKTLIVKNNGKVYVTGLINESFICEPRLIENLSNVIKVDISTELDVFLTKDGKVYICGNTDYIIDLPKHKVCQIPNINNAIDISADDEKIFILLSDGTIRLLEGSFNRPLDEDPLIKLDIKEIVSINGSYFLSKDNKFYKEDKILDNIESFKDEDNIKSFKDEDTIKLFKDEDNIKSFKDEDNIKSFKEKDQYMAISKISNGRLEVVHTSVVHTSIGVYRFNAKYNFDGIIDICSMGSNMFLLDNNGDVYLIGYTINRQYKMLIEKNIPQNDIKSPIKVRGVKDIIYISSSDDNFFFVDINYNVIVVGENKNGELGMNEFSKISKPTINSKIIL
jgi:hypothetical protein